MGGFWGFRVFKWFFGVAKDRSFRRFKNLKDCFWMSFEGVLWGFYGGFKGFFEGVFEGIFKAVFEGVLRRFLWGFLWWIFEGFLGFNGVLGVLVV